MVGLPSLMAICMACAASLSTSFRHTTKTAGTYQSIHQVEDSLVNYCRLIEAGYFYGQKFADKAKGLTQADVETFNHTWKEVFHHDHYKTGITTNEFILGARFGEGNHLPFPPASQYHQDYPDTYLIFHLAKETGMMQSAYFSTCPSCKELSIAKINAYLKNTPLRTTLTREYPAIPPRITSQQDAELLVEVFRCMFPDRPVNPRRDLSFRKMYCADTVMVSSKKEILLWRPDSLETCLGQMQWKMHQPTRITGTSRIYEVGLSFTDPCGRLDSCIQVFRIKRN